MTTTTIQPDPAVEALVTHFVDLDGCLAHYDGWTGPGLEAIGEPIPRMMERVKHFLSLGHQVKIFTARLPQDWPAVSEWLQKHGLPDLVVTNRKTPDCTYFWDDRAISVERNTGMAVALQSNERRLVLWPPTTAARSEIWALPAECGHAKARATLATDAVVPAAAARMRGGGLPQDARAAEQRALIEP